MKASMLLRFSSLFVGAALIIVGQGMMSLPYLLQWSQNEIEDRLATNWLGITDSLPFPSYFGTALPLIAAGVFLCGVAAVLYFRQQQTVHADAVTTLEFTPMPPARRSIDWHFFAGIACYAVLITVIDILNFGGRANPFFWFWAILLVCGTLAAYEWQKRGILMLTLREAGWSIAYIFYVLALMRLLRDVPYNEMPPRIFIIGIGTGIFYALWRFKLLPAQMSIFAALILAAFTLYTYDWYSWKYAFWGDEGAFFGVVYDMFRPEPSIMPVLDWNGVYSQHPVLSTYIHYVGVVLNGGMENRVNALYGWKMTETVIVMLGAVPLYILLHDLIARFRLAPGFERVAVFVGVIVYLASHYLLGFTKLGYNNLQALVPMLLALAFLSIAVRRRSLGALFAVGTAAGMAFYVFPIGVPLIPVYVLGAVLLYDSPGVSWGKRVATMLLVLLIVGFGVVLTTLPRIVDTGWVTVLSVESNLENSLDTMMKLFLYIIPGTVYALLSHIYFGQTTHYVAYTHLDKVSSTLMMVGLAVSIILAFRRPASRHALWMLALFGVISIVTGGLSRYNYPTNTRMFLFVPLYAVFAAVGFAFIAHHLRSVMMRLLPHQPAAQAACSAFAVVVVIAVIVLNGHQYDRISPYWMHRWASHELVRQLQQDPDVSLLVITSEDTSQWLTSEVNWYGYSTDNITVVPILPDMDTRNVLLAAQAAQQPPYTVLLDTATPYYYDVYDVVTSIWGTNGIDVLTHNWRELNTLVRVTQ